MGNTSVALPNIVPIMSRADIKDGAVYYLSALFDTLRSYEDIPTFIPVMEGAKYFWSWLRFNFPWIEKHDRAGIVEGIKVSSYTGSERKKIKLASDQKSIDAMVNICSQSDGHIFLVEDIIDSGETVFFLRDLLVSKGIPAARIGVITLFYRVLSYPGRSPIEFNTSVSMYIQKSQEQKPMAVWAPWVVKQGLFLVGCGMDYSNCFRDLPFLGYLPLSD